MDPMKAALILIIAAAAAAAAYFAVTRMNRSKPVRGSNVIALDAHRKARSKSGGEQVCSHCHAKGKLIFYAQDNGSVVGLCKNCRSKADERDMMPL
ncbi:hypothetical protein ACE6ED_00955 [Paenibacillus sp. CN-4]|uniref:hypothetical protein n=1 Tax=Paenibacillus nanchangensis TaxID=3348343 RepID=UPI0039793C6F